MQLGDALVPQVGLERPEMVPVVEERLGAEPALVLQMGKEARHPMAERLPRLAATGVAQETGDDQPQQLLDRPARSARGSHASIVGGVVPGLADDRGA